jgi:hypothetical protein
MNRDAGKRSGHEKADRKFPLQKRKNLRQKNRTLSLTNIYFTRACPAIIQENGGKRK